MLTGQRAFPGDDITDTLATVLKSEPDWTKLPPDVPGSIRRLLRRCLEKDPKLRLRDAGGALLELRDALSGGDAPAINAADAGSAQDARRARITWVTRDGRELMYLRGGPPTDVMRVDVTPEPAGLRIGTPEPLAAYVFYDRRSTTRFYDAEPSGERLLFISRSDELGDDERHLRVVVNWGQELRRLVSNQP